MNAQDDPEFHLDAGVDIASKRWTNWDIISTDDLREFGRKVIHRPLDWVRNGEPDPANEWIRDLEQKYPELQLKPPQGHRP